MQPEVQAKRRLYFHNLGFEKYPAPALKTPRKRASRKLIVDITREGNKLTPVVNLRRRSGRWFVRFTLAGKQWERSTGESDRDKALCKISEIVNQVARKIEFGVSQKAKEVKTLSELAEKYIPYAETTKAETTTDREQFTMRILMKAFGDKKLHEITCQGIELYMQKRTQEVKNASVNRELALLRHMLNKAIDWGYLKFNPAQRVKPLKEPPGRDRHLSDSERERLLDACTGTLKAIVLTALLTGMRKGELENLTWDDVDLECVEIALKRTKNNEKRYIPISSELYPVLESLRNENPHSCYVFSKPDGTAYGNCRKGFESACKRAGIKDFRFHDLRHTFASSLVMEGVDLRTVQELMGHKSIAMTTRYSHVSRPHLRAAVEKIRA